MQQERRVLDELETSLDWSRQVLDGLRAYAAQHEGRTPSGIPQGRIEAALQAVDVLTTWIAQERRGLGRARGAVVPRRRPSHTQEPGG